MGSHMEKADRCSLVRWLVLVATIALAASSCHATSPDRFTYQGVNLAGGDFGYEVLPGEFGTHYTYPTDEEIDYFIGEGMNLFRLPFLWERVQPEPLQPLDPEEVARLGAFVDHATGAGATVLLDPHNYARYYDDVIGTDAVPIEWFTDFWTQLASRYASNDLVIFGLMNEPADMPTELWLSDANAAVAAIRNTGADNLILVPGNGYTGAHSWNDDYYGTANAEVMTGVIDPADNFAIEVHQYLDVDSSGTSADCVSDTIGSQRLLEFTDWLHENDQQAFLGEFAASDDPTCLLALEDMLTFVEANTDVWLGWSYWAAGPWWGDDMYEIEPSPDGPDDAQMDTIRQFLEP